MRKHMQSVPGEKPPGVVDPPGLALVCAEEVVKARECALDAGFCGPCEHQAALGVDVADFFGAGERVPESGVVSQSESKGGVELTKPAVEVGWRSAGASSAPWVSRRHTRRAGEAV